MDIVNAVHEAARLYQSKRHSEADERCSQILQQADVADAWHLRGRIAYDQKRFRDAVQHLQQALRHLPNLPTLHRYLGLAYRGVNEPGLAESHYLQAIQLNPEYLEVRSSLGILYKDQRRWAEAETQFQYCIRKRPDDPSFWTNLGVLLRRQGDLDQALHCHRKALSFKEDHVDALNNLGSVLTDLGELREALEYFERAIAIDPQFGDAQLNRAGRLLAMGNWAEGWPAYEWRWSSPETSPRHFATPTWKGEKLSGKRILIYAEQGLGDTLQFVRYLPMVHDLGAEVILECQPSLLPLLEQVSATHKVARGGASPPHEVQCALMSLPGLFSTRLDSIPLAKGYLAADSKLRLAWKERLREVPGFRVGIAWRGNPLNSNDRERSFELTWFREIAKLPGVSLVLLQQGAEEEKQAAASEVPAIDWTGSMDRDSGPFMDTAALMSELDLVITADTSLAHLAGALGVRTWIPLPMVPDWRWLLERSDTPWYASVELFRQTQRGDWSSVFEHIRMRLRTLL